MIDDALGAVGETDPLTGEVSPSGDSTNTEV
jgi:hypothetical protein